MKPIIILPEGAMSAENIKLLNDNDICVVEAKDPAAVKFVDPIPAASSRTEIENAAIQLSRKLLSYDFNKYSNEYSRCTHSTSGEQLYSRADIARLYVDLVTKGTPLDEKPSQAERERVIFDDAKADELRRLAREEAKAERAAAKAAKATQKKT